MNYVRPFFLFNRHLETIYPALLRKVSTPPYTLNRLTTPDNDFLDTFLITQQSERCIIISHGLEGNALRPYMVGMANAFFAAGFDVILWNFRGCGEELNHQLRFYHSGATDDLDVVVQFAQQLEYSQINLIGFSLGGNMTLKYLGERLASPIHRAVALSVPLHLASSCQKISEAANRIYSNRFLNSLKSKIVRKAAIMPEIDTKGIDRIKTLFDFDDRYTAPLHGFEDADHYYNECSSTRFVQNIQVPTLIINALNDPFLSRECYPVKQLERHPYVKLDIPEKGGHVGFSQFRKNGLYWSEERALHFIN